MFDLGTGMRIQITNYRGEPAAYIQYQFSSQPDLFALIDLNYNVIGASKVFQSRILKSTPTNSSIFVEIKNIIENGIPSEILKIGIKYYKVS